MKKTRMNYYSQLLAISVLASGVSYAVFAHSDAEHQHSSNSHESVEQANSDEGLVKPKIDANERVKARNYFTDLPLKTQDGKAVRFYSDMLDDRVVLINVMFSSCDNSCPMLTKKLVKIKDSLGPLFGERVHFVSLTNDPSRDDPQALKKFAEKQGAVHPAWHFLTGDKQNVNAIISKLGLYTPRVEEHKALLLAGNTRTGHWIKLLPTMPDAAISLKLTELATEG